jgi:hypothetical protein
VFLYNQIEKKYQVLLSKLQAGDVQKQAFQNNFPMFEGKKQ